MAMRLTNKKVADYLVDKLSKREEEYKRVMNIAPDGSDALCERKIDEERDYLDYKAKNQDEYRYAKLGQLENIEDELGIDLVTLFKALKDGVFIKNQSQTKYPLALLRQHYSNHTTKYYVFDNGKEKEVKLNKYGKTWALTKEELE